MTVRPKPALLQNYCSERPRRVRWKWLHDGPLGARLADSIPTRRHGEPEPIMRRVGVVVFWTSAAPEAPPLLSVDRLRLPAAPVTASRGGGQS